MEKKLTTKGLIGKKCVACEGKGVKPMKPAEAKEYIALTKGWKLGTGAKSISREFKFKDFMASINFVNEVSEIAESEGHHPDIAINWNKVTLVLTTHAIKGLSQNDFIVAAKTDALIRTK
ncbi:MAG: 4a-hydroxytetrahydrobiopterin dehydratase [bacterium]